MTRLADQIKDTFNPKFSDFEGFDATRKRHVSDYLLTSSALVSAAFTGFAASVTVALGQPMDAVFTSASALAGFAVAQIDTSNLRHKFSCVNRAVYSAGDTPMALPPEAAFEAFDQESAKLEKNLLLRVILATGTILVTAKAPLVAPDTKPMMFSAAMFSMMYLFKHCETAYRLNRMRLNPYKIFYNGL